MDKGFFRGKDLLGEDAKANFKGMGIGVILVPTDQGEHIRGAVKLKVFTDDDGVVVGVEGDFRVGGPELVETLIDFQVS